MPARGSQLLKTIHALPAGASAAAMLRHAERHPILDATSPTLAELTTNGIAAAEAFGAQLREFAQLRLFHSTVKRCQQTSEAIARGARASGLAVELVGAEPALSIDYIVDLQEAGRLTMKHGDHFVRLWIDGQIAPTVVWPAKDLATRQLDFIAGKLSEPAAQGRRLDLHVSHDWNILVMRELLAGVRLEEAGWLDFLDGVALAPTAGGVSAVWRDRSATTAWPSSPSGAK